MSTPAASHRSTCSRMSATIPLEEMASSGAWYAATLIARRSRHRPHRQSLGHARPAALDLNVEARGRVGLRHALVGHHCRADSYTTLPSKIVIRHFASLMAAVGTV